MASNLAEIMWFKNAAKYYHQKEKPALNLNPIRSSNDQVIKPFSFSRLPNRVLLIFDERFFGAEKPMCFQRLREKKALL